MSLWIEKAFEGMRGSRGRRMEISVEFFQRRI